MAFKRTISDPVNTRPKQLKTSFYSQTPGSDSHVVRTMIDQFDVDEYINDDEADNIISQFQFVSDETCATNPAAATQDADHRKMGNDAKVDLNNSVNEGDILRGEVKTLKEKLELSESRAAADKERLLKAAEEDKSKLQKQLSKISRELESKSRKLDLTEKQVKELADRVKNVPKKDEQTETSQVVSRDICCGSSHPSSSGFLKRVRSQTEDTTNKIRVVLQQDEATETTPVALMDSACETSQSFASPLKRMRLSQSPDTPDVVENDMSFDNPIPPTFYGDQLDETSNRDENAAAKSTVNTSCSSSVILPETINDGIDIIENLTKIAPLITGYDVSKACGHFLYKANRYVEHEKKLSKLSQIFTTELIRLNTNKCQNPDLSKMKSIFQLVKCHLLNYFDVISRVYDLEKSNVELPADVIAKLREVRGRYLTWNQLVYSREEKSCSPFENLRLSVLQSLPLLECSCFSFRHIVAVSSLDLINSLCSTLPQYSEYCGKLSKGKIEVNQNNGNYSVQVIDLTQDDDHCTQAVSHSNRKLKAKKLVEETGILPLVCILATTKILPRDFAETTIKGSLEILVTLSANGHLDLTKCEEWLVPDYMNNLLFNWKMDTVIPKLLIDILFNCRNDPYITYYLKECNQDNSQSRKSLLTGFASVFGDIIESIQCGELLTVHYDTLQKSAKLLHSIFRKNKLVDIHNIDTDFTESLCLLLFELNVPSNSYANIGRQFTMSFAYVLKQIKNATKTFNAEAFRMLDICVLIEAEKHSETGKVLQYAIPMVPNEK